jgi:hypothetical protein
MRTGEESVDKITIGRLEIFLCSRHEMVDLVRCRRQADQIKAETPNQCHAVGAA